MKEYGRKPYMSKSYNEMMKRITNKAMWNLRPEKQSEFEKPYKNESYAEMQHFHPTANVRRGDYPVMPIGGIPVDEPWTVLFACAGNLCYCEGTTRCAQIVCNQQVIGIEPHFCDSCVTITYSGNEVCVTVAEGCGVGVCGFDVLMLATTVSGKVIYGRNQLSLSECGDCCVCAGISIGHTTHQMAVDEEQNLTALGAVAGCTYAWAITSGGGSLSEATGTSVTYTAPSSNAECTSNPTITLTVEGSVCDTLAIAVNASASANWAARVWTDMSCLPIVPGSIYNCYLWNMTSGCDGTNFDAGTYPCQAQRQVSGEDISCEDCYASTSSGGCYSGSDSYDTLLATSPIDLRTAPDKTDGCCPSQLL